MAEYQPASPLPPALQSNASNTGPCNYRTPYHGACALYPSDGPLSSGPLSPVECVILGIAGVWLGTVAVIACRLACRSRRRRREEYRESLKTLVGTPPRPLILPMLRDKEQNWSTSPPLTRRGTFSFMPTKPGTLRLPAACLRDNGYARLRDTVPCRTLGGLEQSDAGRLTVQPIATRENVRTKHDYASDVEAEAAAQGSPTISDPDSTLSYPEWIRPYLPTFREQAKQEWNVYRPQTGLVAVSSISPSSSSSRVANPFPVIVVQPCNEVSSSRPDSPDSAYSITEDLSYEGGPPIPVSPGLPQYTPCLVLRSRGSSREENGARDGASVAALVSSELASPVSFYFPTTPTFNENSYLQVPSTSCDSPGAVDETGSTLRQTQADAQNPVDISGETTALQRTRALKAKENQDPTRDVDIALTYNRSFGADQGPGTAKTVGLEPFGDALSGSVSISSDMFKVLVDVNLDLHRWLTRIDKSSRDSTIRFSDVLGHFHSTVPSSDSTYSHSSLVSNSSDRTTNTEDSADCNLREIIDLYRRRDTHDGTSSLHRTLDGWVTAATGKGGSRLAKLGPNLPYGPPRSDYTSKHSAV